MTANRTYHQLPLTPVSHQLVHDYIKPGIVVFSLPDYRFGAIAVFNSFMLSSALSHVHDLVTVSNFCLALYSVESC